ncbi:MAG: hypothetical protein EA352_03240 [Gemmatimonadales bacterium]|nr:MAG: hypothetical protein EA352_03240 [Gemmatimonadales bacterium]
MTRHARGRRALVLLLILPLLGCRGGGAPDDLPVEVAIQVAPTPPVVGPALVMVDLLDAEGDDPVEGARVRLEGTMTHAGMVPVHAHAEEREPGHYRVEEFEFTMGGDWILRVHIELKDGAEGVREFDLQVVSPPSSRGDAGP